MKLFKLKHQDSAINLDFVIKLGFKSINLKSDKPPPLLEGQKQWTHVVYFKMHNDYTERVYFSDEREAFDFYSEAVKISYQK